MSVPSKIAESLHQLGKVIDPMATASLYGALHEAEPYLGVTVERDMPYGPDPLQSLDVFTAASSGAGKPVLIFVHGGAFVGGDKHFEGSFVNDNIVLWAARQGFVGVNINYRLAPAHAWPTGALDTAAAVAWVKLNIASYGGDPDRLILMGHSAGAVHLADFIKLKVEAGEAIGLSGAILVSGLYDFALSGAFPAYHGDDPALYAARSNLDALVRADLPMMVVDAALDPAMFVDHAELLNQALTQAGRAPRFVRLADHSHLSEVFSINTDDDSLSGPILAFVQSQTL